MIRYALVLNLVFLLSFPVMSQDFYDFVSKGDSCAVKQNYSNAIKMYYKALELKSEVELSDENETKILLKIADAYSYEGEYKTSLGFLNKYVEKAAVIKNASLLSEAYNKMGINYDHLTNFDQALRFYNKCIAYADTNSIKAAKAHNNIANILHDRGQYNASKTDYLKALKIFEEQGYFAGRMAVYMNLAEIELKSKKVETALHYLEQADLLARSENDSLEMVNVRLGLANFHTSVTDYALAEQNLLWSLETAQSIKNNILVLEALDGLSGLFKKMKDFEKSYNYLVLYHDVNNNMYRTNADKAYANLEAKYLLSEGEKENILLKSKQEFIESQVSNQRVFIWILISLVILSLLFIILFYIQRLKTNKSKKALELQNKKIKKSETQLRDLNHQYEKLIEQYEGGNTSKRETMELT